MSSNPIHVATDKYPATSHTVTIFQQCPDKYDSEWQQLTLGKWWYSATCDRKLYFQPRAFLIPRGLGVVIDTRAGQRVEYKPTRTTKICFDDIANTEFKKYAPLVVDRIDSITVVHTYA